MDVARGIGLKSGRGPILLGVLIATFLIAIESTILSTAVSAIVGDLGGFEQFPWLFSGYLLAQAVTTPIFGKLADVYGRKPIILIGTIGFILTSILCGCAWDMTTLIAARVLQGVFAGAIMPTTLTIVADIYSVRELGRVQGYTASAWASSAVLGPTLGGLFVEFATWRWIFWINIPIGLFALWLLWTKYHEKFERQRQQPDILGMIFLTAGLTLLVLVVLEGGQTWAWNSWELLVLLAGAMLSLVAFGFVERRAPDPMIAPWVARNRIIVTTSIASFFVGVVLIGLVTYVPSFLQATTGVSAVLAGLSMATINIGWALTASLSGRMYMRFGFRATVTVGGTVAVIFSALGVLFALTPSAFLIAISCTGVGLGLGLVASPTLIAAQTSVILRRRGVVSGVNQLARAVGSGMGAALYGAIANGVIHAHGGTNVEAIHAGGVAVFVGVAVVTVSLVIVGFFIPHIETDASAT